MVHFSDYGSDFSTGVSLMKMFILSAAIIFSATSAFAALNPKDKVMFGIHANAGNNSGTASGPSGSSDGGIGAGFGMKIGYGLSSGAILYSSVDYQYKSSVIMYNAPLKTTTYSRRYLDTFAGFRFMYKKIFFDAGPYFGLGLGKMKYDGGTAYKGELPDNIVHNDFGFLLGFGFMIRLSDSCGLELGVQDRFGLVKIVDGNGLEMSNNVLALNVGFMFLL
jgi:hypothetical protein